MLLGYPLRYVMPIGGANWGELVNSSKYANNMQMVGKS